MEVAMFCPQCKAEDRIGFITCSVTANLGLGREILVDRPPASLFAISSNSVFVVDSDYRRS